MRSAYITIDSVLKSLDTLAPFALAEEWDNSGLLIGDPATPVTGILTGLDPTTELLDEAIRLGANLVITHHPLIFPTIKAIRTDQPIGAVIAKAIRHDVALIACHTNLDVVPSGVSHILAQRLGLTATTPLAPVASSSSPDIGFGRIGSLPEAMNAQAFLARLRGVLGLPVLAVAGPLPTAIRRVAVCGGSGAEFAATAMRNGAQVYVTGEIKHHLARWAEAAGFCLIDAGHYATECLIAEALAATLAEALARQGITIPIQTTKRQNNPFSFFMAENDQQPSTKRYGH